jgi:hypothetical protein
VTEQEQSGFASLVIVVKRTTEPRRLVHVVEAQNRKDEHIIYSTERRNSLLGHVLPSTAAPPRALRTAEHYGVQF